MRKLLVLYLVTTIFFLVGAWQFDILCANLVEPVKDAMFYYWFGSLSKWDHYALFFWMMGLAYFVPLAVLIAVEIRRWLLSRK